MYNIVIWGAGKNCKVVLDAVKKDKCNIVGIVDSNELLYQKKYMGKWTIDSPQRLINGTIDYIIISVEHSKCILQKCKELNIESERIIDYWNSDERFDFIDANVKVVIKLEKRLKKCECRLRNMPYELGVKQIPTIRSAEELLEIILKDRKSLSRFGDGELELMQERERPWFQSADNNLAERLKEVFACENENLIVALADDFGSLECYTEEAADMIRQYLDNGVRERLMKIISLDRVYYDAYVTRPYIIYKNKQHTMRIFELFKKIWKERDILLVEGSNSYIGVRNDLFASVNTIKRIIAPSKNAFSVYKEILTSVKTNVSSNTLVLISLGPTATVLAYDLAKDGIQAIDIGQIDNEYEWYLRGAVERIEIPGKCVAELAHCHEVQVMEDIDYTREIIYRIEID